MIYEGGQTPLNASLSHGACKQMLAACLVSPAVFNVVDLRLCTGTFNPNAAMKLNDFTEASCSGYALVTGVAMGTPVWDSDHASMASVAAANKFSGGDGTTIQTITGFLLTDGATSTANVLFAEKIVPPVSLGAVDSSLTIIPVIRLDPIQP